MSLSQLIAKMAEGNIPVELCSLSYLKELQLCSNNFTGSIVDLLPKVVNTRKCREYTS